MLVTCGFTPLWYNRVGRNAKTIQLFRVPSFEKARMHPVLGCVI